jgi:hypothetical protein
MNHDLVVDSTNFLYRNFYARPNDSADDAAGLAQHVSLMALRKYFNELKPTRIVMAFDRSSWRKEYTKSDLCVSKKIYKGDRRQNQTEREKARYARFQEHVAEFELMMTKYTKVICLSANGLEADDLIAGWIDMHPDNKITILSADKDFVQLLDNENVSLLDPLTNKYRTLDGESVDFHLFVKCIRANEDNIQSAFPGVRKTRLKKAYTDPFEMANLMEHTWTREDGITFTVGDLYQENRHLMDLHAQPKEIKRLIVRTILDAEKNPGEFNMFQFLRFCGKFKLEKIAEQFEHFVPMLSK